MNNKIVEKVMSGILSEMEKGIIPWEKPWFARGKMNLVSKKPYRGINRLLLAGDNETYYLTFKQCQDLGGHVKRGAKGRPVIFWKISEFEREKQDGTKEIDTVPLLRYYTVFRVSDCEGITIPTEAEEKRDIKTLDDAERYIEHTGAKILHTDQERAFYSPMLDYINVPLIEKFKSQSGYYCTAFHELAHWTGHESRLKRHDAHSFFGNEVYSLEELVAEISAAIVGSRYGLENIKSHAAYCQSWLKALKNDKKMLITAASRAEKAVDYLDGLQPSI